MARAKDGDTIKVNYTGKLEDGSVFDSSQGGEPLEFKIGDGTVIPGFENGALGLESGQSKTVSIPWDQGYGPWREELLAKIPIADMPEGIEPKVGQRYHIPMHTGGKAIVTITEVTETEVSMDGNHPLAGKDLTFDIELVEIVS